jgi:hypothetical protein
VTYEERKRLKALVSAARLPGAKRVARIEERLERRLKTKERT